MLYLNSQRLKKSSGGSILAKNTSNHNKVYRNQFDSDIIVIIEIGAQLYDKQLQ